MRGREKKCPICMADLSTFPAKSSSTNCTAIKPRRKSVQSSNKIAEIAIMRADGGRASGDRPKASRSAAGKKEHTLAA